MLEFVLCLAVEEALSSRFVVLAVEIFDWALVFNSSPEPISLVGLTVFTPNHRCL